MPAPNPDHLLEQADRLVTSDAGAPRQTDLRRAISSSYYAVFHALLAAAADQFIGATKRTTREYGLVYRSIDHKQLKSICAELKKPTPSQNIAPYVPPGGMGGVFAGFAATVLELQEKRHTVDYDPIARIKQADAILATATARSAITRFNSLPQDVRLAFLALVSFRTR